MLHRAFAAVNTMLLQWAYVAPSATQRRDGVWSGPTYQRTRGLS
ncbi:hypothetical protein BVIET440_80231 [Burkholderia vietnamiensis]|nr:hypothetical protein BVI1335_2130006 [Burkholderia vietnamiensis]